MAPSLRLLQCVPLLPLFAPMADAYISIFSKRGRAFADCEPPYSFDYLSFLTWKHQLLSLACTNLLLLPPSASLQVAFLCIDHSSDGV